MSFTATATRSSTMTEARVHDVMQKVMANLWAFVLAGHLGETSIRSWASDITYLMVEEVMDFFEVQISGRAYGLRYRVSSDGTLQQDSASGGIDVYGIPKGSSFQLYAHIRPGTPSKIYDELRKRGWGFDGRQIEAPESEYRSFSNEGYGLTRAKLGTWP